MKKEKRRPGCARGRAQRFVAFANSPMTFAVTDAAVSILGEIGTGKELFATSSRVRYSAALYRSERLVDVETEHMRQMLGVRPTTSRAEWRSWA
jgi:hypothetical protein